MDEGVHKKMRTQLKYTKLLLNESLGPLDLSVEDYLLKRKYPAPEVREVRRKISTAIAMIEEILGDKR
jgi:hypothetical protein